MNKRTLTGACALLILGGIGLNAQKEDKAFRKEIAEAREVIAQYVDTKQEIAKAKNQWESYQELTERRISLYEQEIADLRETIESAEQETTQAEKKIAEVKADINRIKAATRIVEDALPGFEDKLRELATYFPDPLKNKLAPTISKLGKSRTVADRLAVVIGILNEVDKFNSEFFLDSVDRTLDSGTRIQVDVLYLGLAGGYYANADGTFGGVISPAQGEWEWTEKDDLALNIRKAIQYYSGDIKPALLVELPFDIVGIETGY